MIHSIESIAGFDQSYPNDINLLVLVICQVHFLYDSGQVAMRNSHSTGTADLTGNQVVNVSVVVGFVVGFVVSVSLVCFRVVVFQNGFTVVFLFFVFLQLSCERLSPINTNLRFRWTIFNHLNSTLKASKLFAQQDLFEDHYLNSSPNITVFQF